MLVECAGARYVNERKRAQKIQVNVASQRKGRVVAVNDTASGNDGPGQFPGSA